MIESNVNKIGLGTARCPRARVSLDPFAQNTEYGGVSGNGEGALTPERGDDVRGGKGSDPHPARGTRGTCERAARTVRTVVLGLGAAAGAPAGDGGSQGAASPDPVPVGSKQGKL